MQLEILLLPPALDQAWLYMYPWMQKTIVAVALAVLLSICEYAHTIDTIDYVTRIGNSSHEQYICAVWAGQPSVSP